jgi:hypothetical protein
MMLFIGIVWFGFRCVGETLRASPKAAGEDRFMVWAIGSSLFAHAATCVSVAYFDQSVIFLYLTLAVLASQRAVTAESEVRSPALAGAGYAHDSGATVSPVQFR